MHKSQKIVSYIVLSIGMNCLNIVEADTKFPVYKEEILQPNIDIDLTPLNANMLYAEVFNMEMYPEEYKDKIIKVSGTFGSFPKDLDENGNPKNDEEIFSCIVSDAMACCMKDIEFIPKLQSSFWKEKPNIGDKITVIGRCRIFEDESGFFTVVQLIDAIVEIKKD